MKAAVEICTKSWHARVPDPPPLTGNTVDHRHTRNDKYLFRLLAADGYDPADAYDDSDAICYEINLDKDRCLACSAPSTPDLRAGAGS